MAWTNWLPVLLIPALAYAAVKAAGDLKNGRLLLAGWGVVSTIILIATDGLLWLVQASSV